MSTTPKLELLDFDLFTNGVGAFFKLSRVLDGMLHIKVRDSAGNPTNLTPPPSAGEVFRVLSGSLAWSGESGNLAIAKEFVDPDVQSTWDSAGDWTFITPAEGFVIWMETLLGHRLTYKSAWSTPITINDLVSENEADTAAAIASLLAELREHGVIPV